MPARTHAWHDAQYNARASIPEAMDILRQWSDASAATRAERPCELDLVYGDDATERLDLFLPTPGSGDSPAPVFVYIHGGYWRALDKRDQSFVAAPFAAADLPPDLVKAALALSGIFDLEPLRQAPFLAPDLRLDAATARRLSPAAMPAPAGRLVALVGAVESAEFQRQNRLIARRWGAATVPVCETLPGRHHMTVLSDLATPGARAHRLALQLLGLDR